MIKLKNTITELKNTIEGFNKRLDEVQKKKKKKGSVNSKTRLWNSSNQSNKKETRMEKSQESLGDLWDNMKHTNIHITGVPEKEENAKEAETLLEKIMATNNPT